MRPLEVLTLVTIFLELLARFWTVDKRPSWSKYLPGAVVVFILLHLIFEGYRWQMVPAYGLAAVLFLLRLTQLRKSASAYVSRGKRILGVTGTIFGLLALLLATAIPVLLPVFTLPQPSGSYPVGSTSFRWVDSNREEIFTPDPSDVRQLLVQAWYPAEPPAGAETATYWEDAHTSGSLMAGLIGMPAFLFDHLSLVKTHTYPDSPVAPGESSYPVLIFSHGYNPGMVSQNSVQMEELASHGYIIFSISHTYETLVSIYPDGEVVPYSDDQQAALYTELVQNPLFEKIAASTDEDVRGALFRQIVANSPVANQSLNIWTKDTIFVLDELERLNNENSRFSGRLDLSRIGIFGMSFGGATAGQVCLVDSRCQAGVNLDGLQVGSYLEDVILDRPFMVMYSESNKGMNDFMLEKVTGSAYSATVAGAEHFNFTDFTIISPLFQMVGFLGPIDGRLMADITSAYVLAFFDKHLKGMDAPLLGGSTPDYPEVTFEVKNP